MKSIRLALQPSVLFASVLFVGAGVFSASGARAESMPADMQKKVEAYTAKMQQWAADPTLVSAVKEANAKGGLLPGMTVGKWDGLEESDPVVKSLQTSPAGVKLAALNQDKGISKLYLRDEKGNLVASTSKPLLFNNFSRPQFASCFKSEAPWNANEVKSDPSTGVKGVHLCVPVLDGKHAIGVLHSSVNAH